MGVAWRAASEGRVVAQQAGVNSVVDGELDEAPSGIDDPTSMLEIP